MKTQATPNRINVSAAPALALQRKCACGGNAGPTGECEECRQKRIGPVQRSALGAGQPSVPPIVRQVLASPGRPLDTETRSFFEPRLGQILDHPRGLPGAVSFGDLAVSHPGDSFEQEANWIADHVLAQQTMTEQSEPYPRSGPQYDLGQIRIHTDRQAAESARQVHARAYAVGNNIVFDANWYAPYSQAGRWLLAHELVHTIQPGAGQSLRRVPWTPTHADERTATGGDRFASQTFEVNIPALTGVSGRISTQTIAVSIFVPSGVRNDRNKIHIFFGPGAATETGLSSSQVGMNAVMTHGFRGASDSTEWILIGIPGRVGPPDRRGRVREDNAFNTIDIAGIVTCLRAAGRPITTIDALRFSSHSRGSRGLRETISRRLIAGPTPERVVIFDAAFSSLDRALTRSGIPARNIIALNVVDPGRLTMPGGTNISLPAAAMRAIGYSRIIQDAMTTMPTLVIPTSIRAQLLPLPARGTFTSRSPVPTGMVNIVDFARTHRTAISRIVANETNPTTGLKTFIDSNNLIRLGTAFSAGIYSHHLFVAELAHEVVD